MEACREAYGKALLELKAQHPELVVLDADLAEATYTKYFRKAYPDDFFECGIAEQNMMAVAAGLATTGLMPFVSTFAVFATLRASEQFRNSVCYPHLNVKVAATHAGIECGADGATHQALEDIAVMRTIAGTTVLVPADAAATRALVFEAAAIDGPVYLRMGREKLPEIYKQGEEFHRGGSKRLREGGDVAILACGSRVKASLDAAEILEGQGIQASVYDMYSVKPLDMKAIEEAMRTGLIVTVEDHQRNGGMGSAVCEAVCESGSCRVERIGINDSFGRSGAFSELEKIYGIDSGSIATACKVALNR